MSQSIPTPNSQTTTNSPGQPLGIRSKKLPRRSGFDFSKLPGGREFDKGQDFVESSNHAKRHINVCSGGDLCSPFINNFSETHYIKVGLDVRISLVRVLSAGRREEASPPPSKKSFS